MSEPITEQIARGSELALAAIRVGSGYYNDCSSSIYPVRREITLWNDFPALFVEIGDEEYEGECIGGGVNAQRSSKLEIMVFGYVKGENPRPILMRLVADARRAMLQDVRLGGVAVDTEFAGFATDLGFLAPQSLGEFAMRFVVTYNWTVNAQ